MTLSLSFPVSRDTRECVSVQPVSNLMLLNQGRQSLKWIKHLSSSASLCSVHVVVRVGKCGVPDANTFSAPPPRVERLGQWPWASNYDYCLQRPSGTWRAPRSKLATKNTCETFKINHSIKLRHTGERAADAGRHNKIYNCCASRSSNGANVNKLAAVTSSFHPTSMLKECCCCILCLVTLN